MTFNFRSIPIGELCQGIYDGPHATPAPSDSGAIFLGISNFVNGKLNLSPSNIRYISEEDYPKWTKRVTPKAHDIVFSYEATLNLYAIIPDGFRGCLGRRMALMRPDEGVVDYRFLYYYMFSPAWREEVERYKVNGSTVDRIPLVSFPSFRVDLPNMRTQKAIADILFAIDQKIDSNSRVNDNLLGQMQALYRSWFVDFLPFGGSKPRTWTETDIYSLANIIYGAPFKSKQFNTDGVGTPIIRIRDLKDQQFATYTTEIHPKGYLLQPGDIVVGMDGEFRPYIWGNDGAWLNQRVCVFENKRPNGKAFLYFTIKPLLYGIEQTQVATTVIHIGKKDFDAFEITLPDASTLDAFDALTAPMMRVIVSNSFENKRLAALRDILLPKLLSGEIDVSAVQL